VAECGKEFVTCKFCVPDSDKLVGIQNENRREDEHQHSHGQTGILDKGPDGASLFVSFEPFFFGSCHGCNFVLM